MNAESDIGADTGFWIKEGSDEFDQLRHYLNACLIGIGDVHDLTIWKINNISLDNRFERRNSHLLKLISLVDFNTLGVENRLPDVFKRGFKLNPHPNSTDGMIFSTGVLDLKSKSTINNSDEEYSILYSEIAIGRTFVCDYDSAKKSKIPPSGYDSFYIPSEKLDKDGDGVFCLKEYRAATTFGNRDASEYNHKYLLKDSSQVCPKYLYRFKLNPSGTKHNNEEKNGIIKVSTGNHGVNSIANPDDFEFFDPVAYKPLSNKEKIAIANGNKPIVTIQNAYDQALQEMQVKDPLLNGKKEWMEKQFDIIDEKVRVVNLNYAEVCEHMTDAADKARKELQLLTKQKLEIILSVDIELRRQKEQIGWLDSFIDRQRKQSLLVINSIKSTSKEKTESKLSFLNSWKNHMIFRNSISRFTPSDSSILSSISGDLHADSNINITKIPNQDSSKNVMNSSDINKITGGFAFENMDIDGSYGHNINDIKAAEKRFKSFFSKGYYGVPFKPLEDLVSDSLKGVFNEHLDRIDIALTEAMKDGEIPLPTSIIRPNIGGDNYKLPLPEILTNKQSQNNSNAQKVVNSNEVKLVFQDTLRKALGLETVLTKLDNSDTGTIAPSLDSNSIQSKQLTLASTKQSTVDMSERRKTKAAMIIDTASIQSQSQNNETSVTDDLLINNDIQSNSPLRAFSLTPNGNAFPKGFNKDEKITMSMEDLMTISEKFPQFSLIESSERKLTQLESRHVSGHIDGIASLEESNILADINEIRSVYFTLPFFTKPPNCTLLYSTFKHRRFLDELYLQCLHNRGPSIIIIQSGLYKFGVYLSHPIHINGSWTGGPSCFIFSITLDIKLSYHARNPPDATTANDTPIAFLVDRERLTIGNNDLIINQDIESGSSNIEGCFGFGNFTYNSKQSKCFLAGTNKFTIDQLEVWSINSPK